VASIGWTQLRRALGGLFPRQGGQGIGSRLQWVLPGTGYDYETEAGDLWNNSVVALGLKWLSDRFTKPPIRVSRINRSGEYVPLPRHDLVDLWNRPNKHYTRRVSETAVGLSLTVDGNGYLQKIRDKSGKLRELWWQPHFQISPTWPEDGSEFVSGYELSIDGELYRLERQDVIHFRAGIDPRNVRLGLAPLKACLREVCTVNEESGFTASLLRNSAVPGLVIVPDDPMLAVNEDDARRIKAATKAAYQRDGQGSTAVLGGKYKVVPVGFSPEQLRLDRLPASAVARVASATGVEAMSLGLPDPNKTFSNKEAADASSWSAIQAIQHVIADTLRWDLLPEFGTDPYTHLVEFDYTEIRELQESLDSLHARTREDFKYGLMQLNEARDVIGLEPDPDGDRWFPGTGGGEDVAQPMPGVDPADVPAPSRNGDGAKGWRY
jgi:HK97 family phage portal protein